MLYFSDKNYYAFNINTHILKIMNIYLNQYLSSIWMWELYLLPFLWCTPNFTRLYAPWSKNKIGDHWIRLTHGACWKTWQESLCHLIVDSSMCHLTDREMWPSNNFLVGETETLLVKENFRIWTHNKRKLTQ